MSEDLGSPTEAAIADRRLKVLMEKHHISIEEINRTETRFSPQAHYDDGQRTPVRRKRTRSSVQWKKPQPAARLNRVVAIVAMFGFVTVLGLWVTFTGDEGTTDPISGILQTHRLEKPARRGTPSLTTGVDRVSVFEGEPVVLYINGSGLTAIPDTSSLWQDFKIIGTDVTQGSNGQDFRIRMMLEPLRSGTLIIPSFSVDNVRSTLIVMDVLSRR